MMEQKHIGKKIRLEFKQWSVQPRPHKDWELIWVITGFVTTWDGSAARNDTRRRFEEGVRLAKKIAVLRKGKIPEIYISGYDEHNILFKKYRAEGFFEKTYSFPDKKLLTRPPEGILHTRHQFEKFPRKFLAEYKKIVIVTDAYHMPRVKRYVDKFFKEERDRFVFYPAKPTVMSRQQIHSEVQKILLYAQKGDLPLFTKDGGTVHTVVTGATGFLGSHLVAELSRMSNVTVTVFDKENHSFADKKSLQGLLEGADVIFHLAGIKRAEQKNAFQFNTRSTKAILDAMRITAPDALLVFASSFAVYRPPHKGETVNETHALQPRSAYGVSKLKCERMIHTYSKRYGTRAIILRISNPYGPTHRPSNFIVDSIFSALQKNTPVDLWGSLEETRDYIYVSDVVAALTKTLTRTYAKGYFNVFNICTGKETSTASLLAMIERQTGRHIPLTLHRAKDHVPGYWKGSLQKAEKGLPWHPSIGIRRGLRLVFR